MWALSTSPAVVHIALSIEMVARRWAEASLLVNFTIPAHLLVDVFEKWGRVYHTSAAYVMRGTATAVLSGNWTCHIYVFL